MTPADRRAAPKRTVAYPLLTPNGCGLIARNGHILQPPRFHSVQRLRLRDAQGRPLDQHRYFALGDNRNGRIRYAIFEESGRKHTDFVFDEITAQEDLIVGVGPQRTLVFDGTTGAQMLDLPYKRVTVSDGVIVATKPHGTREKPLAMYARTGRRIKLDRNWPTQYPIEYHCGLALVFEGANAFYIDKTGRVVIHNVFGFLGPGNYGDVFPFNDAGVAAGRTKVKTGNRFGIIDKKGNFVHAPDSPRIRQFMDGRFAILREKEKLFAIHNPKAGKLTEPRYSDVLQEDFSFLSAKEGERWHMLDQQGNPIAVPDMTGYHVEQAEPAGPTCLMVQYAARDGKLTGLLSTKGTWLIEPGEYEALAPYCAHGQKLIYRATLTDGTRQVLLAADGSAITQPYESIAHVGDDLSCAVLGGQAFLIDLADRAIWKSKMPEPEVAKEVESETETA